MIKIKTQSNTVSITDTAVQDTPLVEEEVGHINIKVSKVKMHTRSELATDNIYVTAKNMITLNQIHKGVDDAAVQIYPEPTIVAVPTLSGTYTYTGQEQTVTISTYDPAHIAVSGTTAATNAGTYTVVFSLIDTDADVWEDGTTEDKTATWVIGRQPVEIPTIYTGYTQTFDGYTHRPFIYYNGSPWSYYDFVNQYGNIITVGGDISVTNAGEYEVTFDLVDGVNKQWSDGTIEQRTETWEVQKAILTVPVAPADIPYDTYSHSAPYVDRDLVLRGGTYSATNVGTYTATYDLIYPNDSQWSDDTTEQKSITWQIVKGPANIEIASSYTMQKYQAEEYLSYSHATGNITSVTSSNSSKVSVSNDSSNSRLILKSLAVGDVTITINIAGNDNAYAGTKTISISNSAGMRYYQTITALSQVRQHLKGGTVGNYMVFAGGLDDFGNAVNNVDAYNASLVRSTPTSLSFSGRVNKANVGNYLLFAMGTTVNAYNTALTRSIPTALSSSITSNYPSANIGNYALFARELSTSSKSGIDTYNTSLTRSTVSDVAYGVGSGSIGVSAKNHALLQFQKHVIGFDTSLTATEARFTLSDDGYSKAGARAGDYGLFAGGYVQSSRNAVSTVAAYDTSLTKSSYSLPERTVDAAGTTVNTDYGLIGGGRTTINGSNISNVVIFNNSLTRSTITFKGRYTLGAASLNTYALFAGGRNGNTNLNILNTVEALKLVS